MGRLTTYDEFGEVWIDYNRCVNGSRDVLNKLAHYEDLEEQGRLIKQKHGRWLPNVIMIRSPYANNYYCSECGKNGNHTPYCPHCGAKWS